jgi:hypothetical protein
MARTRRLLGGFDPSPAGSADESPAEPLSADEETPPMEEQETQTQESPPEVHPQDRPSDEQTQDDSSVSGTADAGENPQRRNLGGQTTFVEPRATEFKGSDDPRIRRLQQQAAEAPPEQDDIAGFSDGIPGGRYIVGARSTRGRQYGGQVVDANGKVLRTFEPDQVNTGLLEDEE